MAVSHYWVSLFEVGGLIVGLYGLFFLSIGVFGKASVPWFRALLPAGGAGLGMALALPVLASSLISPHLYEVSRVEEPRVTLITVCGALAYSILTYSAAVGLARRIETGPYSDAIRRWHRGSIYFLVGITVLFFVFGSGIVIIFLNYRSDVVNVSMLTEVVFGLLGAWFLSVSVVWMQSLFPSTLDEKRLQKLGFFLSAFAVITQFVPPVLDLLNIQIVK